MNSEPYATPEDADAYHGARQSSDDWFRFSDAEKMLRLMTASDFIDTAARYIGKQADATQPRQWPRFIPDSRGHYADDTEPVTPFEIRAAVCEMALIDNLTGTLSGGQKLSDLGAGILLQGGDCDGGCDGAPSRFTYTARLIGKWCVKNIPIFRG